VRFKVQGSKFKVQSSRFKVQGSRFKVQGSGFRVQGSSLDGRTGSVRDTIRGSSSLEAIKGIDGHDIQIDAQ
jgi:hypothetical protein